MRANKTRSAIVIGLVLLLAAPSALAAKRRLKRAPKESATTRQIRQQRERIELLELKIDRLEKLQKLQGGSEPGHTKLAPIVYP